MDSGKQDRLVIFDCDIGADDAWALAMLLRAETLSLPDARRLKVIAITCVQGNTEVENGSLNALRVLKLLERTDVPVFKGCGLPLVPRNWTFTSRYHGNDGFKDVGDYPEIPDWPEQLQPEHAVNAMYRLVCEHPKQVDFLLCGPLTNFANCISLYDDAFLDKIGAVYIMGGNIYGQGNITKSAEFNFMMDPEAAHATLERLKEPAVILPWEPCNDDDFTTTLDWRLNELGAVEHPFVKLLTRVEREMMVARGIARWRNPDAALTAAYLFPKAMILDQREYHAAVELAGVHTRGQLVLDHLRGRRVDAIHGKKSNVRVIRRLDRETFRTIISWTGYHPQASVEEFCHRDRPASSQVSN